MNVVVVEILGVGRLGDQLLGIPLDLLSQVRPAQVFGEGKRAATCWAVVGLELPVAVVTVLGTGPGRGVEELGKVVQLGAAALAAANGGIARARSVVV